MHKFTPKNVIARMLEQMQTFLKEKQTKVFVWYILSFFYTRLSHTAYAGIPCECRGALKRKSTAAILYFRNSLNVILTHGHVCGC